MNKLRFAFFSVIGLAVIGISADYVQFKLNKTFKFTSKSAAKSFFANSKLKNQISKTNHLHTAVSKSMSNEENIQRTPAEADEAANASAASAAVFDRKSAVVKFMNSVSGKNWKIEAPSDRQLSFFGAKTNQAYKTEDETIAFVNSALAAGRYENVSVGKTGSVNKATEHETINEFKQHVDNVEVYGSYVRVFRDADDKKVTDLIFEVNEYNTVSAEVNHTPEEAQLKLIDYYSRLNREPESAECSRTTFYVEQNTAVKSYICTIHIVGNMPQKLEAVVDASNLNVLFQKTLSIYN